MISKASSALVICSLLVISKVSGQVECPIEEGVSFIPHPECSWYYICADGESVLLPCPGGLYFNPDIHECDFPENVPECEGGTRPTVPTTTVPTTTQPTTTVPTSSTTPTPEPEPTEPETSSTVSASSTPDTPEPEPTESTTQPPITEPTEPDSTTTQPPVTEPTEPEPTTTQEPPSSILNNCGDTFVGDEGTIEYKMYTPYIDYERCAFIIRTLNHSNFLFTLEVSGIMEDPTLQGGGISIFSFGATGLLDSTHLGPPNPLNTTFVQGSVAVVIFKSEVFRGTGFRLRFQASGFPVNDIKNFDDMTFSTLPGSLAYPPPGKYLLDTASLFVISNNNRRTSSALESVHLNVSRVELNECEDTCSCDFLDIFSFDVESLLINLDRVCNQASLTEFDTRGLYILFFRAEASEPKIGFEIDWNLKTNTISN